MALLTITQLRAHIGARALFSIDHAALSGTDRVALIGPNGVGKSTLVGAVMAAHATAARGGGRDEVAPAGPATVRGGLVIQRGLTLAHIPQRPPAEGPAPDPRVCAQWRLPSRPLAALSAGQRTRAALGAAFALSADLLILDEPTNHLDVEGLRLLELALRAHRGGALIVSHDRTLLDAVATHVWELDRPWEDAGASLRVFAGNFAAYRRQAAVSADTVRRAHADYEERRDHLQAAATRQAEWAQRAFAQAGARAPHAQRLAKKMAHRAKAYERRLDRLIGQAPEVPRERDAVAVGASSAPFAGRWLWLADDVLLPAPGTARPLLRCPHLEIGPRARIALMGGNGAGKSTLLRMLSGEVAPLAGRVWRSPSLLSILVPQDRPESCAGAVPPEGTALDLLARLPGSGRAEAWATAAALGLRRDRAAVPVAACSGGERTAVGLAFALQAGVHLLLLDEPTNHLDVWLREAVESALQAWGGAAVIATHDRRLVESWADQVWRIEPGAAGGALRIEFAAAGAGVGAAGLRTVGVRADPDEPDPRPGDAAEDLARRLRLAALDGRLAGERLRRGKRDER